MTMTNEIFTALCQLFQQTSYRYIDPYTYDRHKAEGSIPFHDKDSTEPAPSEQISLQHNYKSSTR